MFIKNRIRNLTSMISIWVVLFSAIIYYTYDKYGQIEMLGTLISVTLMVIGIVIYLGKTQIISVYGSLRNEKKYNFDDMKVSSFVGKLFFLLSVIMLFATAVIELKDGVINSTMFYALFVIVLAIGLIYVGVSNKFKGSDKTI